MSGLPTSSLDITSREPVTLDSGRAGERIVINVGPSHPSTHGVGRFITEVDGDIIVSVDPVIGYLHRGIEKIAENRTYLQVVPLTDRLDYVGSMYANWAYCRAVERLASIPVPERAEYIRVIVCELQRVASHMMGLGASGADTGAFSFFVYAFDLRERIIELFEELCGSRLTYNYVRPGGVAFDLPDGWTDRVLEFTRTHRDKLHEMDTLFFGNVIARGRMKGVGQMSAADALSWGAAGPVLRASGVNWDLRKHHPYSVYPRMEFDVVVGENGDAFDRGRCRLYECYESFRIIEQAISQLSAGAVMTPGVPRLITPPPGDAYSHIEGARGSLGVYLVSDGTPRPYRMHVRSPAFCNLSLVSRLAPGHPLSDMVVILGSLDPVFGEIDR